MYRHNCIEKRLALTKRLLWHNIQTEFLIIVICELISEGRMCQLITGNYPARKVIFKVNAPKLTGYEPNCWNGLCSYLR